MTFGFEDLHEKHPFVQWWIANSGWHQEGVSWKDERLSEMVLAWDAWAAGWDELRKDMEEIS